MHRHVTHAPTTAQLAAQVGRLRRGLLVVGAIAVVTSCTALIAAARPRSRFGEIDVGRINVVGPDGRPAVIIATAERLPGVIINGREWSGGGRGGGLLFYNAEGDEAGGLIFDSERGDTTIQAFGQLTLDRFESDQVAALRYYEGPAGWESGLQVSHFPRHVTAEWFAARDSVLALPTDEREAALQHLQARFRREGKWEVRRLFAGERGRTAVIELRDTRGRQRLRMVVDSLDVARLEFLDEGGRVVYRLPSP